MRRSVYVETSIISYLVGWLHPRDLIVAANQKLTRDWWAKRRHDFALFTSSVVVIEAKRGDPARAAERLELLAETTILEGTGAASDLAEVLLRETRIPRKAELDALHIALAAIHRMDYLLTWNCRHIANANTLPSVNDVCRAAGYDPPLICTPQELLAEEVPDV